MSGTAVHVAVGALVASFTAAAPTAWQVIDGRPVDPKRKFLAVAWNGMDESAVSVGRGLGDYGRSQTAESFEVANLLSMWAGNEITPAVRGEAFAAFDLFDAALQADPTLGGVCMWARISGFEFMPGRHVEGVLAQVRFAVTVQASQ